jgi:hypothetical protein
MSVIYSCPICKSTEVQALYWVDLNSHKVLSINQEQDAEFWCNKCQTHYKFDVIVETKNHE